jgi:hypothetical protein
MPCRSTRGEAQSRSTALPQGVDVEPRRADPDRRHRAARPGGIGSRCGSSVAGERTRVLADETRGARHGRALRGPARPGGPSTRGQALTLENSADRRRPVRLARGSPSTRAERVKWRPGRRGQALAAHAPAEVPRRWRGSRSRRRTSAERGSAGRGPTADSRVGSLPARPDPVLAIALRARGPRSRGSSRRADRVSARRGTRGSGHDEGRS